MQNLLIPSDMIILLICLLNPDMMDGTAQISCTFIKKPSLYIVQAGTVWRDQRKAVQTDHAFYFREYTAGIYPTDEQCTHCCKHVPASLRGKTVGLLNIHRITAIKIFFKPFLQNAWRIFTSLRTLRAVHFINILFWIYSFAAKVPWQWTSAWWAVL